MSDALVRAMKIGVSSYWVPQKKLHRSLAIRRLVLPFRFDTPIWKFFFSCFFNHRKPCQQTLPLFTNAFFNQLYHTWPRTVLSARHHPERFFEKRAFRNLFGDIIQAEALIHGNITQQEHQNRHPVIPFNGDSSLHATSGWAGKRKFLMKGGCHCISFLMSMQNQGLSREFLRMPCLHLSLHFSKTTLITDDLGFGWLGFRSARSMGAIT